MELLILLAEVSAPSGTAWVAPILQFGVGGGVLVWFMLSCTPRLKGIESAIDRLARSILLLVVALPQANEPTKTQARAIITEVDDAEKLRNA